MKLTRKYKATFTKYPAEFTVVYYNGSFKRIIHDKGQIADKLWQSLTKAIPKDESAIKAFNKKFDGKVKIERLIEDTDKDSEYKKYSTAWFGFYEKNVGIKPRFNGSDGRHLKEIIKYLQDLENDTERAYNIWLIILSHWDQLDDFFKQNKDLPFINSQLNKIIQNVQRISHKAGNDPLDNLS